MRDPQRLSFWALSLALAAELLSFSRTWTPWAAGAALGIALALAALLRPQLRQPMLRLFLVLLMTAMSFYHLLLPGHNAAADTLDVLVTGLLWHSFFEDEWPHWKRRLAPLLRSLAAPLSCPVMPLPTEL